MADGVLDCKGLKCPMPIVQLSLAIKDLEVGATLRVEATDPAFIPDLKAWVEITGHDIESVEQGEVKTAVVRKRAEA